MSHQAIANGGGVVAGSLVAIGQNVGAIGIGTTTAPMMIPLIVVGMAAGGGAVYYYKKKRMKAKL
jgi:hypothetical protein